MGGCRRARRACVSVWPPSRREAALPSRLLSLPTSNVASLCHGCFLSTLMLDVYSWFGKKNTGVLNQKIRVQSWLSPSQQVTLDQLPDFCELILYWVLKTVPNSLGCKF